MRVRILRFANVSLVLGVLVCSSGCQSGTGMSSPKWLSSWRQPSSSSLAASGPNATGSAPHADGQNQLPKYPSTMQTPSPSATAAKASSPTNGWANTSNAYGASNPSNPSVGGASPAGYQTGPYAMGAGAQRAGGTSYGNAAYAGGAAMAGPAYSPATGGVNNELPASRQPIGSTYGAPANSATGYGTSRPATRGGFSNTAAAPSNGNGYGASAMEPSANDPRYPTSYGAQPTAYGSGAQANKQPSSYAHPNMPMDNSYRTEDPREVDPRGAYGAAPSAASGGRNWNASADQANGSPLTRTQPYSPQPYSPQPYASQTPNGAESGYRSASGYAAPAHASPGNASSAPAASAPNATGDAGSAAPSGYRSRWQQPSQPEATDDSAGDAPSEPAYDAGEPRGSLPRYPETGASNRPSTDDPQFAARGGFRPGSTGRNTPAPLDDRQNNSEVQPVNYSR